MIKVIVFDMDDTLYKEMDFVKSGFQAVDDYLKGSNISGFFNESWWLFQNGEREYIFNKALERLNVPYDDKLILNLVSIYRKHKPEISLDFDTESYLSELKKEYSLGLISDGYLETQKNKATSLNLERYIEKIIFTDSFGKEYWKPSEKSFISMMKYFGFSPPNYIYIGDNPKKDFIAPNRLGWRTVHLQEQTGIYSNVPITKLNKAEFSISDIRELDDVIQLINKP